jgi:hypothetical protein
MKKLEEWYFKLYLKVDAHEKFHLKKGNFYYGELTPIYNYYESTIRKRY